MPTTATWLATTNILVGVYNVHFLVVALDRSSDASHRIASHPKIRECEVRNFRSWFRAVFAVYFLDIKTSVYIVFPLAAALV